jgi:hypothetical protein
MRNIQQFSIKNLYNAGRLYHVVKYYLPNNFLEVLKAQANICLKHEKLQATSIYQLIKIFGVIAFDHSTLLEFEEKLQKQMHYLSPAETLTICKSFLEAKRLSFKLIAKFERYICERLEQGNINHTF